MLRRFAGSIQNNIIVEPELESALLRMNVQPTFSELKKYNDFIVDLKNGQSLSLNVFNLNLKFDAIYINAAHDKSVNKINICNRDSSGDKTEIGNVIFEKNKGIKSDGSSYNIIPYTLQPSTNFQLGSYLLDNIDITGGQTAIGAYYFSSRGARITFSSNNFAKAGRDASLIDSTIIGVKRFNVVNRKFNGTISSTDLVINGIVKNTQNEGQHGNPIQFYELALNNLDSPSSFLTDGFIGFTFYSSISNSENQINLNNFYNSINNYFTSIGISI